MAKSAYEVASDLEDIYGKKFGGKRDSRFSISREGLRLLACRERLRESFVNETSRELAELGLVLIDLDDSFIVVKEEAIARCRVVPDAVIGRIIGREEFADNDEDEEE